MVSLKSHFKNLSAQRLEGNPPLLWPGLFSFYWVVLRRDLCSQNLSSFSLFAKVQNHKGWSARRTRASLRAQVLWCALLLNPSKALRLETTGKGVIHEHRNSVWPNQTTQIRSGFVLSSYNLPNSFRGSLCKKPWALCKANRRHQKWLSDPVKETASDHRTSQLTEMLI